MMTKLLLLSGGLDSTAIAAVERPTTALFVDYGQRPALAERASARMAAGHLSMDLMEVSVDLSKVGTGLLVGQSKHDRAPTPEWFPFRNQFLVTVAAAVAVQHGYCAVLLGLVAGDGARHSDGTCSFMERVDMLISGQEGGVHVVAPHLDTRAADLIAASHLP